MLRFLKSSVSVILLGAAVACTLPAQVVSGTIGGAVLDASGSSVPNAKVSVTNTDRNLTVRTVNTNASGLYSAPLIPLGTYTVKVEANGFKAASRSGIVVNVNDNIQLNIALEVGAVTETVDVTAQSGGVELSSVANANTIEGIQIRGLPLATRNYAQLVSLMPGVTANTTDELYIGNSSPAGTAATSPYSINGNRNSANNWTVDGADNVDRGSNLTLMTFPSIDAVAQFKVERSMYTADSGRAGGAQINVVTRSGTSQLHGSLYEFVRNDAFNANNWINNANRVNVVNGTAKIPPLRWNDFGGTIGGPVYIPGKYNRDKNKTFFFFSEEARRIITYTVFQPTVPTTGMLTGLFPTPVCLSNTAPCTSTATQVPASLINNISKQYLTDIFGKLPLNATSTTAGFFPQRNIYNSRQEILRVDHTFNDRMSIWGKFENDSIPTTEPGGLFTGSTLPGGALTSTNSPGRTVVIHALQTITPSFLNEVGYNSSQSAIHSTPNGLTAKANSPNINVPEPFANTQGVVPTIVLTGGTSVAGFGPYDEYNKNFAGFDNATWIHGQHVSRIGIVVNRYNKTENAASGQGSFTFTSTGVPAGTTAYNQSFANFLLGNVSTFSQPSLDITPNLHSWQTEAFLQDDFKLTPRMTLSAGVRWSYFGQPTESTKNLSNFDPRSYKESAAAKIDPVSGNIITGSVTLPYSNGIIVGGKNSPFGNKVGNDQWFNLAPRIGIAYDPFGDGKTSVRAGYGVYYDSGLFGTYEQAMFQNPPLVQNVTLSNASFSNVSAGTPPGTVSTVFARGTQLQNDIPYVQQWSFSLQRQVMQGTTLEVTYAGSKGTHLLGIVDINQAYPGVALAAGLHAPGTNTIFTAADSPRINSVRPYLGYNAINVIRAAFDSNYHSLQTNLRKNFGAAGVASIAYTWSKNLTNNGSDRSNAPQNTYNYHNGEYGPATLDRQQVVSANYDYTLPFFNNRKGLVGLALQGWEVSGILAFYTGSPFTVTTSNVDSAGVGLLGNSAASARPDMTCDPNANAPHTIAQWFNTSCFTPTAQGQVRPGNAGRGVVRGPGFANWDASMSKNIKVMEHYNLQLRGEALNVLNHANPNGFGSTNITSTLFGQITSFRAPRRIQLALKLTF